MMIRKLMTSATTGLRMNRSVKEEDFMAEGSIADQGRNERSGKSACGLAVLTPAPGSFLLLPRQCASGILRLGCELGLRRELVVDHDGHAGMQLEDAGGHDLLPGFQALDHVDEIAARHPKADELLAEHE